MQRGHTRHVARSTWHAARCTRHVARGMRHTAPKPMGPLSKRTSFAGLWPEISPLGSKVCE